MDMFKLFGVIAVNRTEVERDLDSIDGKAQGLGRTFGSVFGNLGRVAVAGAAVATAAMAGVAVAGTKAAVDFQKGMAEVFTLLPALSAEARDQMSADVQQFAREAGVLPSEVVPALYQAISAGVPKENVFEFLTVANQAAVGGVSDLATAVDGITSVVNAYGEDVLSATEASDLMFTAVKLGKTDFGQLSNSLFNVIPTASALGVEFGDVTAALAAMTAQGTPTSVATTQLRQLFVELSKEGTKTSDVFAEIAGKSFKEFVAEGGNTQEALQLLEQHASEAGIGINDLFGSVEAGSAALALTGRGTEAFGSALEQMGGSAGATETAFQEMEASVARQITKIRANIDVILIQLGDQFLPILSRLLDWFVEQLPAIQGMVQRGFDIMAIAIGVVMDLVEALRPAFEAFVGWLRQDWQDAEGTTQTFVTRMSELFRDLLEAGRALFEFLVAAWEYQLKPTWEKIEPFVSSLFSALGTIIGGAIDLITSILQALTAFLSGDFEGAFEHTLDAIQAIWETLTTVTETVFNGLVEMILNILRAIPGQLGEIGSDIVQGLADGITGAAGRARDAVEGLAGNMQDRFRSLFGIESPSRVFMGFGRNIVQGLIVGLADTASLSRLRSTTTSLAESIITGFGIALGLEQVKSMPRLWGESIIQGIIDGINAKLPDLEARLKAVQLFLVTNNPGAFVPTPAPREPGGGPFVPARTDQDSTELQPIGPRAQEDFMPFAPRQGDGGLSLVKSWLDRIFNANQPSFRPREGDGGAGDLAFNNRAGANAIRGRREDGHQLERARILNLKREAEERQKVIAGLTNVGATDGPLLALGKSLLKVVAEGVPAFGAALQGFASGGPIGAVSAVFQQLLGESEAFKKILGLLNTILDPIVKILDLLFSALTPIVEVAVALVHGALSPLVAIIENVVAPVFSFVAKIIAGIWNAIATAINWALSWIPWFTPLRMIDLATESTEQVPADTPTSDGDEGAGSGDDGSSSRTTKGPETNFGGTAQSVQLAVTTPLVEAAFTLLEASTRIGDVLGRMRPGDSVLDSFTGALDRATPALEGLARGIDVRVSQLGSTRTGSSTAHLRGT